MGQKILIVDDEPEIVQTLRSRLEHAGYEVRTASNGRDALEQFKTEKPDLIVTDVMMPGMTGYEFFEALRKTGKEGAAVPVIVMSARSSMGQYFEKWSIAAFLPKPFDMPFFVKEVRRVLEAGASVRSPAPAGPVAGKDIRGTALLVGVSEFEMRKMKDFLEKNAWRVTQGLDEKDAVKVARKTNPDLILFEFWEDPVRFDAVKLSISLGMDAATKAIPYGVFLKGPLQNDAMKTFASKQLLPFTDVADLTRKMGAWMETLPVKKAR